MTKRTHYEVLEVRVSATSEELKKAYRKQSKATHPDLHGGDKTMESRFKEVQGAYEVLSDPQKRAEYDAKLARQRDERAREAERKRAVQADAARAAQQHSTSRSPPIQSVPQSSGPGIGTTILVGAALGFFGAILASALSGGNDTEWDPNVQRNRGPDGRFRPR